MAAPAAEGSPTPDLARDRLSGLDSQVGSEVVANGSPDLGSSQYLATELISPKLAAIDMIFFTGDLLCGWR
jgi:hypothetical protein